MITLTLNWNAVRYDGDPWMPLLWFLRDVQGDRSAEREPAPGTQKEFGALIRAWVESGAACPAS